MQTLITIKETCHLLIVGKVKSLTPAQNAGDTAARSPTAQQPTAGAIINWHTQQKHMKKLCYMGCIIVFYMDETCY